MGKRTVYSLESDIRRILEGNDFISTSDEGGKQWYMNLVTDLANFVQREIEKARKEGRREGSEITSRYISDFVKSESGKSGRKEILEYIEELSKLKDNKMEKKGVGIGKDKCILDACCGGRMFWFNKTHPNVLYVDNRRREKGYSKFRPNHTVLPDEEVDFRNMPYKDKSFKLVVFDPPHIFGKENSLINQYYGSLDKETWREDIKRGFDECWRVLDDYGVLIFKWNEVRIPKKDILLLIERQPLFGHQVGGRMQTHWMCFMKIPK